MFEFAFTAEEDREHVQEGSDAAKLIEQGEVLSATKFHEFCVDSEAMQQKWLGTLPPPKDFTVKGYLYKKRHGAKRGARGRQRARDVLATLRLVFDPLRRASDRLARRAVNFRWERPPPRHGPRRRGCAWYRRRCMPVAPSEDVQRSVRARRKLDEGRSKRTLAPTNKRVQYRSTLRKCVVRTSASPPWCRGAP